MKHTSDGLLADLREIVGDAAVLESDAQLEPHVTDWRGRFRGEALCVVKPANREQVAAVVRACAEHETPILPQGGNTSMSGGSVPFEASEATPPVIVNLVRMKAIRKVDPLNDSMEVEAGCLIADIQAAAVAVQRLYPVSFGAEGSAQIGGSVATNAGGTGVLRYGNTRDNVLGLEVVLPDGSIIDGLRTLRKDNSGYGLKHLFIGSEGTLGIVTAVTLALHPLPTARRVAWVAPQSVQAAVALLELFKQQAGNRLSAFEILNRTQMDHVRAAVPGVRDPLSEPADWNLLIELSDRSSDAELGGTLETILGNAYDHDLILDAAIASNEAQCQDFWRIRHAVSEGNTKAGMSIVFDVAVPVSQVPTFIEQACAAAASQADWARASIVSHLGDGNVHFVLVFERTRWNAMADPAELLAHVRRCVYDIVSELGGTWSAEHGIGRTLLKEMQRYKSPIELAVMRAIKVTLDPQGLFNPGKLLPLA